MTDYDDTQEEGNGTTRRRFLGATAAVALGLGAGTTPAAADQGVTVEHGDYGTRKASLPQRDGLSASLELYPAGGDDATFTANGWHFNDDPEESHVGLTVAVSGGKLSMTLDPDQVRELAEDLLTAADHAEHGGGGNGGD